MNEHASPLDGETVPSRPLRILFVVLNFSPEPTGTGKFTGEFAQHLSRQGHDVRVICAPPYYPWWKLDAKHSSFFYRRERLGAISILRCPLYVPAKPTKLRRIIHLVSSGLSLLPTVLFTKGFKPDLVFNVQPTLATSLAATLHATAAGSPLWLHVQDLEIAAGKQLRMIPPFLLRLAGGIERWIYSRCKGISTISGAMATRLMERGSPVVPQVFPNWVDTKAIRPIESDSYRRELGFAPDDIVALYAGNLGEKQGLEIILGAARRLASDPKLRFVLAGDGSAKDRLMELAQGQANVRFLPLQPAERMNEFLAFGDIHLVPQKAGVGDLVMPSKMTAILAAGRPVVVTASPEDELAEVADQCGISVLPGDTTGFANAIRQLAHDAEYRRELGAQARTYAIDNLSACAILCRMEAFAHSLARPSKPVREMVERS